MPDLAAIKPEKIPGLSTTAQLLVAFAKNYFGVPNKTYDSALARATNVYAGFGDIIQRLDSLSDDASVRATTQEILDKLKSVSTPSVKQISDALNRDAGPLFQKREELDKVAGLLHEQIEEDRKTAFNALQYALTAIDPNSQEVRNQLEQAENTRKKLKVELEKLEKARGISDHQLAAIATSGNTALPSSLKTSVRQPATTPTPNTPPTLTSGS
jgi:hypothetical protein